MPVAIQYREHWQKCPSVSESVIHMDDIPPNSQRPCSFHQDFDREVFAVVFSVGTIIIMILMINSDVFQG